MYIYILFNTDSNGIIIGDQWNNHAIMLSIYTLRCHQTWQAGKSMFKKGNIMGELSCSMEDAPLPMMVFRFYCFPSGYKNVVFRSYVCEITLQQINSSTLPDTVGVGRLVSFHYKLVIFRVKPLIYHGIIPGFIIYPQRYV